MNVWRETASIASVTPLLAIIFHLGYSAPATAGETWRVTDIAPSARIHMRQQANNRSKVITYIPGDARGLSGGSCTNNGWCQVEYNGFKGWVFARYLTPDNAPRPGGNAAASTPDRILSLASKKTLQLAKRDGSPMPIYAFPNERLPVAGRLPAEVETVEGLGNCTREWCYVRSGELVGWLKAEAFALEGDAKDQGATAALAAPVTSDETKEPNKIVPTTTQASVQTAATLQGLGDLETKSYTLAGLGGQSSLAMREKPDGDSRILAWIPNEAKDIEGLRKCVEKWCLVRHANVSGWVARRHLADVSIESTQMFQARGVELWGSLDVLDYPSPNGKVVGKIPSYATGIVPIGGCDDDWCHVRYLGIAGWVSGQYLEPQAAR